MFSLGRAVLGARSLVTRMPQASALPKVRPGYGNPSYKAGDPMSKKAHDAFFAFVKDTIQPTGIPLSERLLYKFIILTHKISMATDKVKQMTQKPSVETQVEWICTRRDEVLKELEQEGEHTVAFHGTSISDIEEMLDQHARNEGKLEKRICDNGSDDASLYIMGCKDSVHHYTGSEYMIKVASKTLPKVDSDRGTMYLPSGADIHLLEVLKVDNASEIKSFARPSVAARVAAVIEVLQI